LPHLKKSLVTPMTEGHKFVPSTYCDYTDGPETEVVNLNVGQCTIDL